MPCAGGARCGSEASIVGRRTGILWHMYTFWDKLMIYSYYVLLFHSTTKPYSLYNY